LQHLIPARFSLLRPQGAITSVIPTPDGLHWLTSKSEGVPFQALAGLFLLLLDKLLA